MNRLRGYADCAGDIAGGQIEMKEQKKTVELPESEMTAGKEGPGESSEIFFASRLRTLQPSSAPESSKGDIALELGPAARTMRSGWM